MLGREHSKLPQENKTCLTVTLQNAVTNLFQMINLVKDPWTNPTLSKVLLGYPVNDSEGMLLPYLFKRFLFDLLKLVINIYSSCVLFKRDADCLDHSSRGVVQAKK